jgi:hypothetical protein
MPRCGWCQKILNPGDNLDGQYCNAHHKELAETDGFITPIPDVVIRGWPSWSFGPDY